jgi:hypothetical protein
MTERLADWIRAHLPSIATGASLEMVPVSRSIKVFKANFVPDVQPPGVNLVMKEFRRGQRVLIKEFDGRRSERLVWDCTVDRVLICDEANFRLMRAGNGGALGPVPFLLADVSPIDGDTQTRDVG